MNIITERVCPPIPTTMFDWVAYVDESAEDMQEYGPTEAEALRNLCEKLAELALRSPA